MSSVTKPQLNYIGILFDDLGFSVVQKREFLMFRFKLKFSDELSVAQASQVINELKAMKANKKSADSDVTDSDEVE